MKFQIRFNHTKEQWDGRVYTYSENPPDAGYAGKGYDGVSLALQSSALKTSSNQRPKPFVPGLQGVPDARQKLAKRGYPYFTKGVTIKTDAEFERWFINGVKNWILAKATHREGVLPMPANYVREFQTLAFRKQLAKRIKRTRSNRTFLNECLDRILLERWPEYCEMDRYELYEKIKRQGFPWHTPKSVWQRAWRLGLISKREPGPKYRS